MTLIVLEMMTLIENSDDIDITGDDDIDLFFKEINVQ
jgi:hypothetical protein